ncbi:cell division protein FtsQ [Melghiribacillus thermohalophilus]|uniref:Cell division protein DivIB n=1 Tax=Melghiribacillus thermohalophilus TaxID=1324956 RepID=A0A4R3NB90_9BACI|nr:cell division protein FtsQ/DivIB [Melghiribacillus thermohalophilus]TCT26867.1 cell division protein FtsQ [Melghiribacillus thermohalophilus]
MAQKKIISIEDRIPKLKETKRKKANRKLIIYLTIFFLLILAIIYLQSPLSNIRDIEVKHNDFVSDEEILTLSELSGEENFWKIKLSEIEEKILKNPVIKEVHVERNFYNTISIHVEEYVRVGYVKDEYEYYPILENGQVLTDQKIQKPGSDAPVFIGWDNPVYLTEITGELKKIPIEISALISEIHWIPEDGNPYKVRLYMVNGNEVIASIRNFSEKMKVYPSIAANLDPEQKGILHMDVGAYFEPYKNDGDDIEENSGDPQSIEEVE